MNSKGIILLGHPRSGTTLTRRLLNGHSNIASPPETHLLSACSQFLNSEKTSTGLDIGVLSGLSFIGVGEEHVIDKLRLFAFSFLDDHAESEGKSRWVEKTAFDAFHIPNIEKLIKDKAFYIGIVRHPLDVALSSIAFCDSLGFYPKEMHKYISRYSSPIEAFSHSWLDVTSSLISLENRLPNNCKIIRYEDLINDPKTILSSILSFVGENYEDNMIVDGLTTNSLLGFGDHKTHQTSELHTLSIGKWQRIPDYQIHSIAPMLNPTLKCLGYSTLGIEHLPSKHESRQQYLENLKIISKSNNNTVAKRSSSYAKNDDKKSKNSNLNNTSENIIKRFLHQAERRAFHPAVVYKGVELSYNELCKRVFIFSNLLRSKGVRRNSIVAVYLDRTDNLITTLLAVLHAGGTYVPIDPFHPRSRISSILCDCEPQFIITEQHRLSSIDNRLSTSTYVLNNSLWEGDKEYSTSPNDLADLAYIIFTSGSTGRPKGVEVKQNGLSYFLLAMAEKPGITENDRLLSVTTASFDIAALEFFLPITQGATLYIADREDTINGPALIHLLQTNKITLFQATPATYYILLAHDWTGSSTIKLLCGGEALPPKLASQLLSRCKSLWNMYGPTETTIWSTSYEIKEIGSTIPIGKAISGTQTYILDANLEQVLSGEIGELFIAGAGVSNGYHKREDLTEKFFISNPYSTRHDSIMYRTGDLVKLTEDGDIIYVGRLDNQVKIRGHRIELGEIESAIERIESVEQCAVGVFKRGDSKSLVAYLVLKDESIKFDTTILRDYLSPILPSYMIPTYVIVLDCLPLTPNNKVDRKSLPKPTINSAYLDNEPLSTNRNDNTQSNLQERIITAWKQVLGVENISSQDTYVNLGGDSLSFVQANIALEKVLGYVPDNWENTPIKEFILKKEHKKTFFSDIESIIFIRAIAITLVVMSHSLSHIKLHNMTAGLLMISGLLFAKFTYNKVTSTNSVIPILKSAWKIYFPCTIFITWTMIMMGEIRPDVIFLYSNYSDPRAGFISFYWFIQALIHILILCAILFSFKKIVKYSLEKPYEFGVVALSISFLLVPITSIFPHIFDFHFSTQVNIWYFALGWLIHFSDTRYRKLYLSHVLVLLAIVHFIFLEYEFAIMPESLASPLVVIIFGITLLFVNRFTLIRPTGQIMHNIAAASIFIYLIHMVILSTIPNIMDAPLEIERLLVVIISLVAGFFFYNAWESIALAIKNKVKEITKKSKSI
ncbi:amino acid adenylation domain-containing protein [uncultured Vibrio sp.]|uniref:amino acid adenylation domain-containing protein n=1 Tax=uncultured Vibrio sp. TaxID=114054 RepID=UPI002600B44A|nr:amino acid adenylation domain-containing protein [uncultured Vibrio sp.]